MKFRLKSEDVFWIALGIATAFFITCGHANLAIANYGVQLSLVIILGLIALIIKKKTSIKRILGFLICNIQISKTMAEYIKDCFIFSGLLIAIFVIFKPSEYLGRISTQMGNGPIFEVNYLAFYFMTTIFIAIYQISRWKHLKKWKKAFYSLTIVTNFYTILLTGSRNPIWSFGIFGILFLINMFYRLVKDGKISIKVLRRIIFVLTVLTIIIVFVYFKFVPKDLLNRVFNTQVLDESNISRLTHWKYGFRTVMKSPVLGYGVSTSPVAIYEGIGGYTGAAHNSFLSIWINLGLVGILSVFFTYFHIVLSSFRRKDMLMVFILISVIFSEMIVEFDISFPFWFIMFVCLKEEEVNIDES